MSFINDIKQEFKKGDTLSQLIIVNIAVFLLVNIVWLISFLSGNGNYLSKLILNWLAVPADIRSLLYKPWTLFTYMFLHEDLLHILFNLLFLYFGGRIFNDLLNSKRLLAVYVMGGVAGAIVFILSFNLFPVFGAGLSYANALGASASALAVLLAIASYVPNYTVYLLLVGPVKLKWLAVISVVLDLISIKNGNAGGHIAHLGGAAFGFIYASQLRKGNDWSKFFNIPFQFLIKFFKPRSSIKVVHRNLNKTHAKSNDKSKQQVIDEILDKISKSGYESLSKSEKEILFKLSKDKT